MSLLALIATPVMAFLGVLLGLRVNQRGAAELDRWRRREETMRLLRWATELAVDADPQRAEVGVAVVDGLLDAPILDQDDRWLVLIVMTTVAGAVIVESEKGHPP